MLSIDAYHAALPFEEFLTQFGSASDRARWERTRENTALTAEQTALLKKFTRQMNVLVLAGAWCGDCAANCPIFERFAQVAPTIRLRYLDRDAHPKVQQELQINGGNRVPVAVFFSEDGYEVGRYGERTLTSYRRMAGESSGEACSTGIVGAGDPYHAAVTADWLREFERCQWILRLSPRLRRLHQD